jgi:CHAT domain-containing protein
MRASGASGATGATRRHATGSWNLVWGNPDAAIDSLRSAARLDPKNASVQSDLAAALLERAGRAQDPQAILEAYTSADSAVALDPGLPEARFNKALALEALRLRRDAIAEWSSYLALDGRSRWADEARQHWRALQKLPPDWATTQRTLRAAVAAGNDSVTRQIARRFPTHVQEETGLTTINWARAYHAGGPGCDSILSSALALARALAMATADSLWLDAVQAIVRSSERHERTRLDTVARALIAYATGDAYAKQFFPDSAAPWLVQAERELTATGNAAGYLAAIGVARVVWLKGSFRDAIGMYRRVRTTAPQRYRLVRELAARSEGFAEATDANVQAAIGGYVAAIREAAGTGAPLVGVRAHAYLALSLADLGLDGEAWRHLYTALGSSPEFEDAAADGTHTFSTAAWLSWRRAPRAASLFEREAIRLAGLNMSSRRDSLMMIGELGWQAELSGRSGLADDAFASLQRAREYIARIEPDSIKAYYGAEADLVLGSVLLRVHPDSALRVLRRVIDSYRHPRYRVELDRALLLFANAYAAVGAMDSAQGAFEASIAETERRRSTIDSREDRARFLDQARPVIDRVVTFLVDRGDTLAALEFLERMRSRVLLERVLDRSPNAVAAVPSLAALRAAMPRGTSVVSYAVLGDDIAMWLIRRDGVSMYRQPGAGRLEQLSARFTGGTGRASGAELQRIAAELHRALIAPFEAAIEPESRVIFVPDKWLHFVPFAALFDAGTGRFVVERFETAVAPSLELYAQSLARYQRLWEPHRKPNVLVVGNPAFDAQLVSLPRLPGAEAEAKRVAEFYPGARLLVGPQATKRALLQDAAVSNIVHFAGHGVVSPETPLLSHLVLAPDERDGSSGMLTARELFDTRLPITRVAILSGCHTASGLLSGTEGVSSLARALFAAGVPAVVASLWAVDDEATADFFASYHRRLSRGDDPTEALRATQVEWIRQDKSGWKSFSTWAAFALFGATTKDALDREGIAQRLPQSSLR